MRTSIDDAGRNLSPALPAQSYLIRATNDQRMTFDYCISATESVRRLTKQMVSMNSHWHYNPKVFAGQKKQLSSSLADLTEDHQQFLQSLSQDQAKALHEELIELQQLETGLNREMWQLDEEWTSPKHDAGSIARSVHRIRKIADQWRLEHKKIATEMDIPQ